MARCVRPEEGRVSAVGFRLTGVIVAVVATVLLACTPAASAEPTGGRWDPLLPKIPSAGAPGDPVAIANASLQATAVATQTAMDLGRSFLSSLDSSVPRQAPKRASAATVSTVPRRSNTLSAGQERRSAFPTPGEGQPHGP